MWPVFITFVLICGYKYIDSDIPSKIELQKAQGWNAYFQVALKGGEFLIAGFIMAVFIDALLYLAMYIMNIPSYLGAKYTQFTFATDLNGFRYATASFFSWIVAISTVLMSIGQASTAKNRSENYKYRIKAIRNNAKKDSVNQLLLESLEHGLLVMVTLKSRKVYVGMVDEAKFYNFHTHSDAMVSIIPFISGYRDKDNLSFNVEHYYVDIYNQKGITLSSEPLSVYQFRHILPIDQIESFSLFDVDTYVSFREKTINTPLTETSH
ncbi:hypothetical protein [Xenorhabdus miraniensis]|uniref:Uncharacterized protein n=1 Tax=Xenorhabdus miraniensis TaxID=351674 RepID=A0A2D0JM25_9GAMM|nr:hypothetical protein [Xenorhabdus miraniensis]PHM47201.1 hypothetical protein Xmir_03414 [Xenorhabdus miraniensis]